MACLSTWTTNVSSLINLRSPGVNNCPLNTFGQGAGTDVCSYTISPASFTSKDCTNGTQQSQIFSTTITPSACFTSGYKGTGSCNASVTGNLEIVTPGGITCNFSTLVAPSSKVLYFSGPKQSNGLAGDMTVDFTVNFYTRTGFTFPN